MQGEKLERPRLTGHAGEVTRLLRDVQDGLDEAGDALIPLVYCDLRRMAARYLRGERVDHTLQPTALVHEAYLRLLRQQRLRWQDRSHFLGVAAQAMRRILVDHARRHHAAKRSGGRRVTLHDDAARVAPVDLDLVALDQALARLETHDPRAVRVLELRYFAGLCVEETAEVLAVSTATVKRDWQLARGWLRRALGPEPFTGQPLDAPRPAR